MHTFTRKVIVNFSLAFIVPMAMFIKKIMRFLRTLLDSYRLIIGIGGSAIYTYVHTTLMLRQ